LALDHHTRALELRQANSTTESVATVSNLLGITHAHSARREHSEAITSAERALSLQEALVPPNETSVATTLALLGKIYQDTGDSAHALDLCTKALIIYERTVPVYCPVLAELTYNIGTIQLSLDALTDAQHSFERSVKIYKRLVPRGHPDRTSAENEYRRVIQLIQTNKQNSQTDS
jgi:tetratricopeptide (TPR) repeat protein